MSYSQIDHRPQPCEEVCLTRVTTRRTTMAASQYLVLSLDVDRNPPTYPRTRVHIQCER